RAYAGTDRRAEGRDYIEVVTKVRASGRISRRGLLAGVGLSSVGLTTLAGAAAAAPFHGPHQAGITDEPPAHASVAAFNLVRDSQDGLRAALRTWSAVAARLTATAAAAGLTVTVGLGPSLFAPGRLGLSALRPAALTPLPAFEREALDPAA